MVDYRRNTGTSGTLIIRDNGTTVTFLLENRSSPTFASGKSWSGTVNGVGVGGTYSISGASTITLGSWSVSSTQNVTFAIGATGTSGLGGPTSFTQRITRATVPPAPSNLGLFQITSTSIQYQFQNNGNGGSPILRWEAQRATNAAFTTGLVQVNSTGTTTFSGLTPGTTYYFRSRGVNSVGAGPWSATISGVTLPATAPGLTVVPSLTGTTASAILTPPGGQAGVTKYTLERRVQGTTTPVTTIEGATSPLAVTNLVPGTVYEYRASAWFGTYQTPWTGWIIAAQPNPNTDPGGYFDGNTPDSDALDYQWTGTPNLSTSVALGRVPRGWRTFAESSTTSGGTGVVFQASGGYQGAFAARAVFHKDTTAYGFKFGPGTSTTDYMADVEAGGTYYGSAWVWPSKNILLRAVLHWYTAEGVFISASNGLASVVNAGAFSRLSVGATAPSGAEWAVPLIENVSGTGGALWLGGDFLHVDAAMVTLQDLFPYFDGNTPDTLDYAYEWTAIENASPSTRTSIDSIASGAYNPLADPDCPPIPGAPRPPQIDLSCVDDVGIWRRYWVIVPESEVYDWINTVPTVTITSGGFEARQVRVRFHRNPDGLPPETATNLVVESEQVITYLPPLTTITLDAVSESVWATVNGGDELPADELVTGANGAPASWALLSCGVSYLISIDVPLEAPEGNITAALALTPRMM